MLSLLDLPSICQSVLDFSSTVFWGDDIVNRYSLNLKIDLCIENMALIFTRMFNRKKNTVNEVVPAF